MKKSWNKNVNEKNEKEISKFLAQNILTPGFREREGRRDALGDENSQNRRIIFLGATKHLYMRVCPSVRPSVRRSIGPTGTLSLKRCETHFIAGIGTCFILGTLNIDASSVWIGARKHDLYQKWKFCRKLSLLQHCCSLWKNSFYSEWWAPTVYTSQLTTGYGVALNYALLRGH